MKSLLIASTALALFTAGNGAIAAGDLLFCVVIRESSRRLLTLESKERGALLPPAQVAIPALDSPPYSRGFVASPSRFHFRHGAEERFRNRSGSVG